VKLSSPISLFEEKEPDLDMYWASDTRHQRIVGRASVIRITEKEDLLRDKLLLDLKILVLQYLF
jgi:hypothetical protein